MASSTRLADLRVVSSKDRWMDCFHLRVRDVLGQTTRSVSRSGGNKKVYSRLHYAELARDALQQLRYDDRFCLSSLQAIVLDRENNVTVKLDSCVFDPEESGWVNPSKVQRMERV